MWARRILASQDALVEEAAVLKTGLSGELRIGTVPSASTTVAPILGGFWWWMHHSVGGVFCVWDSV